MRVKILVSVALINEEKGRWAGLAEELDVPRERGEYLVSVGAAKSLEDDAEDPGPEAETETPQGDDGKAAGTTTTEAKPETGEKKAAPVRRAPAAKK
ncbi:hypothetical protein SEA_MARKY_17 [Streptomyces phage Marky]|nr:hypothetical protein SEA_MARKY_17 [Streptomyces phage Marky]